MWLVLRVFPRFLCYRILRSLWHKNILQGCDWCADEMQAGACTHPRSRMRLGAQIKMQTYACAHPRSRMRLGAQMQMQVAACTHRHANGLCRNVLSLDDETPSAIRGRLFQSKADPKISAWLIEGDLSPTPAKTPAHRTVRDY